jgi:hypothetical protein
MLAWEYEAPTTVFWLWILDEPWFRDAFRPAQKGDSARLQRAISIVPLANKEAEKASEEVMQYILGVICVHQLALTIGQTFRQLRGESQYIPT